MSKEARNHSLRFLSGKCQGSEYVLGDPMKIIVGRSSDADLILLEGMVSRRHAHFILEGGVLEVEDLGSTNGTFVNGDKIRRRSLKEGDRVLIGTSILKVVLSSSPLGTVPPKPDTSQLDEHQTADRNQMAGELSEVSVPELLELFGTSRQSAVLELKGPEGSGYLTLAAGRLVDCGIDKLPSAPVDKCVMRLLGWSKGSFSVQAYKKPPTSRLNRPVPELLVDGLFKLDELAVLRQSLPEEGTELVLARPLTPPLGALDEHELDILQQAHNHGSVQRILDASPRTDLEVVKGLLALVDAHYLRWA